MKKKEVLKEEIERLKKEKFLMKLREKYLIRIRLQGGKKKLDDVIADLQEQIKQRTKFIDFLKEQDE